MTKSQTNGRLRAVCMVFAFIVVSSLAFFLSSSPVSAEAKPSTLSLSFTQDLLQLTLTPTADGRFGKSVDSTIGVSTDNYTGYTLSVEASTASTSLVKDANNQIPSVTSPVSEADFISNASYNNKWGFKPSQYVTSSGGVDTVVTNTDFRPAPDSTGYNIAKTATANQTADSYTVSFGARVDQTLEAGTYTYTYVLRAVANTIAYTVTYDDNTTDTVTNMPVPNPQITDIDGGTPAEDSYVTLSDAVPVRNEKKFAGWCDEATTVEAGTTNDTCPGNLYQAGDDLPVDQTASPNTTLYAVWVDTLFPIVWNQIDACQFNGATNGNITGTGCERYHDVRFIDTEIPLFNQTNYPKDFEIHFVIDHYDPAEQVNYYGSEDNDQQTFVSAKLGSQAADKKAPGVVIRRNGKTNIDFNAKYNDTQESKALNYQGIHEVSMFRLDNEIYYSVNNGPLKSVLAFDSFSQYFDLTTWFGAYPRDDCDGSQGPCTNAKRILQGTLSDMYIRLGEYSDDDIHTINFKKNDGTTENADVYLIKDGNAITSLPTAPTYNEHIFQGWFTEQTGGTAVTASTVPTSSTNYYAHWLGTVAVANITNTQIALQPNASETINVTNSSELEPYTFTSNNSGVATVDEHTGEVTAVAAGVTTITMTGSVSGETRTISVTVAGQVYDVYFDSQGGSAVAPNPMEVGDGGSINPLPTSTKPNATLEGWYSGPNGTGTKLTTSTVFDQYTPTQYYANWIEAQYVCKIAKPDTLHVEQCNSASSSQGCRSAGIAVGADITYGTIVSSSTSVAGDAYDCDVNNDGEYDDETERFYYFGTEDGNAKFVHYQNLDGAGSYVYDTALTYLPDSTTWSNPNLVSFTGDYAGKVARFMTYPEALALCGQTSDLGRNGRCLYLLESSNFGNSNVTDGIWLERQPNYANRIQTSSRGLTHGSTTSNAPRATIEVPVEYVEPYTAPPVVYTITFDPHNETSSTTAQVTAGDELGNNYPAVDPTYNDHLFQGWYTNTTGGTLVTSHTIPSGNDTYHAQWLKTVALAQLARDTIAVEAGETANIEVLNSSELEPYSFSSNNTSIATVDSTTGVVTGVANGSTTITMTGSTSGATKTIPVNVSDLLPVTQAIIANPDLTTTVGGEITIIVSNADEIEPYSFSSADSSIATVNSSTGVITGVSAGTTNIIMTGSHSGLTKTLETTITAAPVSTYTVTFNPNGGSFSDPSEATKDVEEDTALGATPVPTKTNYRFFGWYSDDGTFYQEVYPDKIIDDDVTFYARWIEDTNTYPIEFAEINECTFNGNAVISGTYCTQDKTKKFVDTDIALFSTTNYQKDFEIGFTIVEYSVSAQSESQATLVNTKYENKTLNYPGFVMRRNGNNLQLTGKFSNGNPTDWAPAATTVNRVKIVREDGILKYSLNDGALVTWFDVNANTRRFDTETWFGAASNSDDVTPMRYLKGKLTDMYVRLGVDSDYVINFDAGHGSLASGEESRTITIGDEVGTLPVPTPPDSRFTFVGWYDESVTPEVAVTASTIPDGNKTYVAHYQYQSSDTPVTFNIANDALQGYQTIINGWVQSPVNITTFNKNTTSINDSTWGDTSELTERNYWVGIKNNFETNECLIPSYSDAAKPVTTPALDNWVNGSSDCSKPNVYDTKVGEALNVYLDNKQGAQVAYAKASDGVIRNMIPGQTYYWEQADDSSVYGYVTATSVNGRRFLDTGKIRNTRDLGGLPVSYTDDNNQTVTGTLAYGRLFRGERLWDSPTSELTNLGINKEYDVGDPGEYANDTKLSSYKWDPVIHYNFDYTSGDENIPSSNYMKAWTAITDIMTDIVDTNNPKNIYFHCRVGADRTGTTAYLLEGLLGVPDEARYQEYSLTHLSGLYDRTRYYKQKTSTNNLKFVFMMGYVKTNADIYNWYMQNPNADASLISSFRNAMIVPSNGGMGGAQSSPQSLSANPNRSSTNSGTSNAEENSEDGYSSPMGVSESTAASDSNLDDSSPSAVGLAVAVAAVAATGAAVSFAAAKHQNNSEEP